MKTMKIGLVALLALSSLNAFAKKPATVKVVKPAAATTGKMGGDKMGGHKMGGHKMGGHMMGGKKMGDKKMGGKKPM